MMAPTSTTAASTATIMTTVEPLSDEPEAIVSPSDCIDPATLLVAPDVELPVSVPKLVDESSDELADELVEALELEFEPASDEDDEDDSSEEDDEDDEVEEDEEDEEDDDVSSDPLALLDPDSHVAPL